MSAPVPSVYDLSCRELQDHLQQLGAPAFHGKQVYRHLYVHGISSPDEMTDLSQELREQLKASLAWTGLRRDRVVACDQGLTRKVLWRLPDGAPAETVLMAYPDRATVCVSSQSGCPMACTFCATGKLGFLHDLSCGQMVEQVLWAERELRRMSEEVPLFPASLKKKPGTHWLTNIVFMGMGEPFNNYDQWWSAVERLHDEQGYRMGARNITVSTVGLVPGILRLADANLPVNLAISLHAAVDRLRSDLMPVNKRYPIADLMEAARTYTEKTRRRVSFEYVLLQEKNDAPEQALELAQLLSGESRGLGPMLCHVNLIPWNPVLGTPLSRSNRQRVTSFQRVLVERGIACTVRVERGVEIGAACGQLAGVASN